MRTALKEYERLEATGLWRETPEAQLREVIISFGNASLALSNQAEMALTHWSLAAIRRVNKGKMPAIYAPDEDGSETLEVADEDMVAAIDKVLAAIERRSPRPGRLRRVIISGTLTALLAGAVFWLPDALRQQATRLLPAISRAQIGDELLREITHLAGSPCQNPGGTRSLATLRERLDLPAPDHPDPTLRRIVVLRSGLQDSLSLPGGIILLNRSTVEDHEDPAVSAGFLIAEDLRRAEHDPIQEMLAYLDIGASLRLLTTGMISENDLRKWAEHIVTQPRPSLSDDALLAAFTNSNVPTAPWAWAMDPTGEATLDLIEADPFAGQETPLVLSDDDWVRLQTICDDN